MHYLDNAYDKDNIYINLEIGDIIWAKRYVDEKELLQIPKGHEEGPYLIIGKDENGLKCLYGTSTPPRKEIPFYNILELNEKSYYLQKTSYFKLDKHLYINKERFIRRLGHLNNDDKITLFKKIDLAYNNGIYYDMDIDTPTISLEPGDIISNGIDYYLIIEKTADKYNCLKLLKESHGLDFSININRKDYYINFDSTKSYSKLFEPTRENFIDKKTLQNILAIKKQRQKHLQNKKEISRGSLIKYNNTLYYIYGEINNVWMAFSITEKKHNNIYHIIIDNKNYYTSFNNIEIPKKEKNIQIITIASEKEINQIKEIKKSYTKKQQKETKTNKQNNHTKIIKPEIQVGTIISFANTNSPYLYIVINRSQDKVITLQYNKYLEGKYKLDCFVVNQMEYYDKIDNFNLLEILYKIRNIANGYIHKSKLEKMIASLKTKKLTLDK